MNQVDNQYKELLRHIIQNGVKKSDRTGTGTISIFDYTMKFNMMEGFPLITSKKMYMKGIIYELIWFLRGDTNIKFLVDNDCHIWDGDAYKSFMMKNGFKKTNLGWEGKMGGLNQKTHAWLTQEEFINKIKTDDEFAKKWGELGPIYGKQWRNFGGTKIATTISQKTAMPSSWSSFNGVDQIKVLIDDLKTNPDSRRLMVNSWNANDLDKMVLPPCHYVFQCYTREMDLEERVKEWCSSMKKDISYGQDMTNESLDKIGFPKRKLSLKWTQRSVDTFLGLPFNIASYGLLLSLISKEVNMISDNLIFSGGDVHLYLNHIEQAKELLNRDVFSLPSLELDNKSIFDINYTDIKIINYTSNTILKADLSN